MKTRSAAALPHLRRARRRHRCAGSAAGSVSPAHRRAGRPACTPSSRLTDDGSARRRARRRAARRRGASPWARSPACPSRSRTSSAPRAAHHLRLEDPRGLRPALRRHRRRRKLRAAGAVLLGKTNMDEFAMGSSTENSRVRPDAQPVGPRRACPAARSGGSGGGGRGAGWRRGALGTDTGGSIRQPAALCGIVGLKPTYGRVSRYGLIAFASSLDQVGPVRAAPSRTRALLLEVIAGHDPRDSTSSPRRCRDYAARARAAASSGLRVGVPARVLRRGPRRRGRARGARGRRRSCETLGARDRATSRCRTPSTRSPPTTSIATAEASSNLARYDGVRYGLRAPTATRPARDVPARRAARASAPRSSAASCSAPTRCRAATTTPTT